MAVSSFTMLSSLSAICLSSSILDKTILCFDVIFGTTTLAAALLHMHGVFTEAYCKTSYTAAASSESAMNSTLRGEQMPHLTL